MVSVSPQSRASLAAHYGLKSSEVAHRLTRFLKNVGELDAANHLISHRHPPMETYFRHEIKNTFKKGNNDFFVYNLFFSGDLYKLRMARQNLQIPFLVCGRKKKNCMFRISKEKGRIARCKLRIGRENVKITKYKLGITRKISELYVNSDLQETNSELRDENSELGGEKKSEL